MYRQNHFLFQLRKWHAWLCPLFMTEEYCGESGVCVSSVCPTSGAGRMSLRFFIPCQHLWGWIISPGKQPWAYTICFLLISFLFVCLLFRGYGVFITTSYDLLNSPLLPHLSKYVELLYRWDVFVLRQGKKKIHCLTLCLSTTWHQKFRSSLSSTFLLYGWPSLFCNQNRPWHNSTFVKFDQSWNKSHQV